MAHSGRQLSKQAQIGRRKLRAGSLIVLGTMVFIALFSLYFVTTVNVHNRQFAISPKLFLVIMLLTIPLLGWGIDMMVKGYRMETQSYMKDLKEIEKKLEEIATNELNIKT